MSDFKLSWHSREVALEWPLGSVVVARVVTPFGFKRTMPHKHSFLMTLYFSPATFADDKFKDWEFLLLEEPQQNKPAV